MTRVVGGALLVLVLLAGAAILGANALLNSQAAHDRIVAALERATGHAATIGPGTVAWSLHPGIAIRQVALLNGAGFSRPAFATVERAGARIALLPLLRGRVEIPSVTVEGLDVLLERDGEGRGNWQRPPAPTGAAPGPSQPRRPVEIGTVQVVDGRIAWLGVPPVLVPSLTAAPSGGPVAGTITIGGVTLQVMGSTDPAGADGDTFLLGAQGGGLSLYANSLPGSAMALDAGIEDLAAWGKAAGRELPPLHQMLVHARVGAAGADELKLLVGDSDLGSVMPGLHLTRLRATSDGLGQPLHIEAEGALRALPLTLDATVAQLGPAPWAVQGALSGDAASLTVDGTLTPASLAGSVAVKVPDLQRSGVLAGLALPGLHDAALDVRVQPAPSGAGVLLRGLRVVAREGDLAGDLAVGTAPRPSLAGTVTSQRLDLDAILAPASTVAPTPAPVPTAPAPTSAPGPAPPASLPMIPDHALPFAALRRADVDVTGSAGQVGYRGAAYAVHDLRLLLRDGQLRVGPAVVTAPGGPIRADLQADAAAQPPTVAVVLHGAGLDGAALAGVAGAPGAITGQVDVDVDVKLAGETAHALAASAGGHVALALTEGDIDNQALAALFGPALRGAGVSLDAAGRSRLRCLAVRAEATAGQVTLQALTLDASKLRLEGDGQLDLGGETMDLHLRPELRIGPFPVKVPVHVSGPWRAPHAQADKGVIAPGRFGISIGAASADPCPAALAQVRQDGAR